MALTDEEKTLNDTAEVSDVIDLKLDEVKRTRFRINGRDDLTLELNLSDMKIFGRLEEGYENFQKEISAIGKLDDNAEDFTKKLHDADVKMRKLLDYIFDAPVSKVCDKGGTMYDMTDGVFRFESIIETLSKLYTNNLNTEFKKIKERIKKHTEGIVPQDHKKSTKSQKRG